MNTDTTVSDTQAMCAIVLTDSAQERILDLRDNMHKPAMIRLYVQGGGCSGFEYKIDMTDSPDADDLVIEVNPWITLYVDPFSAPYLDGTTVDYVNENLGSRFVFNNPQASSTCGCGSSFSVG